MIEMRSSLAQTGGVHQVVAFLPRLTAVRGDGTVTLAWHITHHVMALLAELNKLSPISTFGSLPGPSQPRLHGVHSGDGDPGGVGLCDGLSTRGFCLRDHSICCLDGR